MRAVSLEKQVYEESEVRGRNVMEKEVNFVIVEILVTATS